MGVVNGKNRFGRKLSSAKGQWKNNKNGFRKDLLTDAAMTGVNAVAYNTGIGQTAAAITGKDVNDLLGYEMKTELGKDVDKVSNTVADTAAMVAPAAVGIGVTAATGSPQAGQAAMQGTTALQGMYDSIDTRETDSYLDPDMAAGGQQILNQGASLGLNSMSFKYGGKMSAKKYKGPMSYADGGQLTEFNEGGSHEENPNGGIPQGPDANVEEGETKVKAKDYIFSDRITASKGMLESLNLSPKWAKKSFSEISKLIQKKYDPTGKRETDSVVQEGINRELERLILGQEAVKIELGGGQAPQGAPAPMAYGGPINYPEGGYIDPVNISGIDGSMNYTPDASNLRLGVDPYTGTIVDANDPFSPSILGDQNRAGTIPTRSAPEPYSPTINSGEPGMTKSASGEGINVNYGDATNAFMGITSTVNSMANIRDLKKNKPTPKDLKMFDATTKIRNPKIDYRSIFRANEEAEGRARRSIASNSKNAGDLLSSNIALTNSTQKNNATAYTGTQEAQAKIDMAVDQTSLQKEVGNKTRSMTVQDWNDADNQRWTNALIEARNQMGNNMRQTAKNQMNLEAGKAVEGK